MIGAGLVLVYGGITGRLAPMIAALFVPDQLVENYESGDGGGGLRIPIFPIPNLPGLPEVPSIPIPFT